MILERRKTIVLFHYNEAKNEIENGMMIVILLRTSNVNSFEKY